MIRTMGSISIYYQNVRELRTKTTEFYNQVLLTDFNIICVSETWLDEDISSDKLFPQQYTVFRCDRSSNCDATEHLEEVVC